MPPLKTVQRACQVLRHRVRFSNAYFAGPIPATKVRDVTKLYVETWIVPIINMIETGDTHGLARFIRGDTGDTLDQGVRP